MGKKERFMARGIRNTGKAEGGGTGRREEDGVAVCFGRSVDVRSEDMKSWVEDLKE